MASRASILWSSIGRKILMSLSGMLMLGFLVSHLAGNLQLLTGDADLFNRYGYFLMSLGGLVILAELILLGCLLLHVWAALSILFGRWVARPERYRKLRSAGGPSRKTWGASTMIYTGFVVLVFIALHVTGFKYGPGVEAGYVTEVDGVEMRDLHRLVVEVFSNTGYVAWYVAAMVVLGFHLSHAFWSAFQSLGIYHDRYTPILFTGGRVLAFLIAAGYAAIPIWIYICGR